MWWQSKAAVNIKHSIPKAPGALRVCGESCRRDTPKILPPFNCSCLAAYLSNKNWSWNAKNIREPGPRTTSIQVPLRHQKTDRKRETGKDHAQIEGLKCLDKLSFKIILFFHSFLGCLTQMCSTHLRSHASLKKKNISTSCEGSNSVMTFLTPPFFFFSSFCPEYQGVDFSGPICSSDRSCSLKALWFSWCTRHKLGSPFS